MAYLYETYLFTDTTRVVPIPDGNTENLADFVDNHKATALEISEIALAETTFRCDCTFPEFDAKVTDPIEWSDVKYIARNEGYELYLLSDNPL